MYPLSLSNTSQHALLNIYRTVISFFNTKDIDDSDDIAELLAEIEGYKIAIPQELYGQIYEYVETQLSNLPPFDVSDLVTEDNIIPSKEALCQFAGRHFARIDVAKQAFIHFAHNTFAYLLQE